MKKNNDIIKQPMKNINTMKIMKKFLFLKIFLFALYSPTIFAITCSTGSGGGGSSSGPYSWSQVTDSAAFGKRYGHSSVVFDDKMWVIGGEEGAVKNDVYNSDDGKTWTPVRADGDANGFTARRNHESVVFDDGNGEKMWVIGGNDSAVDLNDVWSSTNGKTWSPATTKTGFTVRQWFSSVVFDDDGKGDKIWVMGGIEGFIRGQSDVWNSTNGKTWNKAVDSTLFKKLYNHSSVVFDRKMWVIGGYVSIIDDQQGHGPKNDVFSSEDGKAWEQDTGSAQFGIRNNHQSVVFDDGGGEKMWVIGGNDRNVANNDVWSSADGVTWDESTATVGFTARSGHTSLVFNNSIWVIGGNDGNTYFGDVWSYSND